MTIRELIQKLLLEAPNLNADVYIFHPTGEFEGESFDIKDIKNGGSNESLYIIIKRS